LLEICTKYVNSHYTDIFCRRKDVFNNLRVKYDLQNVQMFEVRNTLEDFSLLVCDNA
jgi:hypothetical protein